MGTSYCHRLELAINGKDLWKPPSAPYVNGMQIYLPLSSFSLPKPSPSLTPVHLKFLLHFLLSSSTSRHHQAGFPPYPCSSIPFRTYIRLLHNNAPHLKCFVRYKSGTCFCTEKLRFIVAKMFIMFEHGFTHGLTILLNAPANTIMVNEMVTTSVFLCGNYSIILASLSSTRGAAQAEKKVHKKKKMENWRCLSSLAWQDLHLLHN